MGRMRVERQMQGDLIIGGLVVLIEVAGQQGRTSQADFRMGIIVNGGVNLQNNKIVQKRFEGYTDGRYAKRV